MIAAIAGGVGAAKLLQGLLRLTREEELTIICNTGDDLELYGLHISPDLDIIMYTLAGVVDEGRGWGIRGDTFNFLEALGKYGYETWFNLGDRDLATHVHRTLLLRSGYTLSQATEALCRSLGLRVRLIPMTDQRVETYVSTDRGDLHFQEYFVKRGARDKVLDVTFRGAEGAEPSPGVIEAIREADGVIVCPSNPIVSIGPILCVKPIRVALTETEAKVVGVSPIVGGRAIKGPADKLMSGLGLEVSAYGVAKLYEDFLDDFIIDRVDEELKDEIESLGVRVTVTNTIMEGIEDKVHLAKIALELIEA